jgi:hypothetical protein
LVYDATDHDPAVLIGENAHIVAASDGGPRADASMGRVDKDDYKNLILLCRNCHRRVDQQPHTYIVERLKTLKSTHEDWVRTSLPERALSATGWTSLFMLADHPIDTKSTSEALAPDFVTGDLISLRIENDPEDWGSVNDEIAALVRRLLTDGDIFEFRLAVFPLAPVSACVALGYHLTNRPNVRCFQYHRDDRSWVWPPCQVPPQDLSITGINIAPDPDCQSVVFVFSVSARITAEAIAPYLDASDHHIYFTVDEPSSAWLCHPDQLRWFAGEARQAFENASELFPNANAWHFFFAGPASLAVVVGQQINPTMCPNVHLYEYSRIGVPPHKGSIVLGNSSGAHRNSVGFSRMTPSSPA